MGLSYSKAIDEGYLGGRSKFRLVDVTFDSSYASGGEPVSGAEIGLSQVTGAQIVGHDTDAAPYVFRWDKDNNKLMAYLAPGFTPAGANSKPTFTVEASGAIGSNMEVGLSGDSAAATFEGGTGITAQRVLTTTSPVGTPSFAGTAVAAAVLAEAGAINLAAMTIRVLFIGF